MTKLDIQFGDSLKFENGLIFRQPLVSDVKKLGETVYYWFMHCWMRKPQDMLHHLFSIGKSCDEVGTDEIFEMSIKQNESTFLSILCTFTNFECCGYDYFSQYEGNCIFGKLDDGKDVLISPNDFDIICEFIRNVHFFKHAEMRVFSDDATKKKILEYEIEEMNFNRTDDSNFSFVSMVSSVITGNQRTWDYVYSLTINKFYDEYFRIVRRGRVDALLQGVYSGNIDSKKISQNELDWTSSI